MLWARNHSQTWISHFSAADSTHIKLTVIFYGPAKTDAELETYLRHKSSFPVDTFCSLTAISELGAGALTLSLVHVAMLSNVTAEVLPMQRPGVVSCFYPESWEGPACCSGFIRFVLWLSWGNCYRFTEMSWLAIQKDFPRRDLTGKGCKILSESIPVTISQADRGPGQVCCSQMLLDKGRGLTFLGLEKYI